MIGWDGSTRHGTKHMVPFIQISHDLTKQNEYVFETIKTRSENKFLLVDTGSTRTLHTGRTSVKLVDNGKIDLETTSLY